MSSRHFYMIGKPELGYSEVNEIPKLWQVMKNFMFYHYEQYLDVRLSAKKTCEEVMSLLEKRRIPIKYDKKSMYKMIAKVEKYHKNWLSVNKNKKKKSPFSENARVEFQTLLSKEFDIRANENILRKQKPVVQVPSKVKAPSAIHIPVSPGKKRKRGAFESALMNFPNKRPRLDNVLGDETTSSDTENSAPPDDPIPKKSFINGNVVRTCDVLGLSSRQAIKIISAVAQALGHDLKTLKISHSSLWRMRKKGREKVAKRIKDSFVAKYATVHWDTKAMPDITGSTKKVERIPIIVSQESGVQLLGIPPIESQTGELMAEAVYNTLTEWNVLKNIESVSFDTTGGNTGTSKGAIILLEHMMKKKLLKLACRHHVYEVILRGVFELKFGKTTAPTVQLFERFQDKWDDIDKTKYAPGIQDSTVKGILNDVNHEMIIFCKKKLEENIVRNDYKELLQLTLIFLGDDTGDMSFKKPGAMSHARWLSKAIYALKIFMFHSEFKLTKREKSALRDFCIFVVKFYVKAWFGCTNAVGAPKQDLDFLKSIKKYSKNDANVSSTVLHKFSNHLWYLSEEPIGLAFFDDNVSMEDKRLLCKTFLSQSQPDGETRNFKLKIPSLEMIPLSEYRLHYFITENTHHFFNRFKISKKFLQTDPQEWKKDAEYIATQNMLKTLEVVNDHAERGVKLMADFNTLITKNEEQKQALMQVVSEERKHNKGLTKLELSKQHFRSN